MYGDANAYRTYLWNPIVGTASVSVLVTTWRTQLDKFLFIHWTAIVKSNRYTGVNCNPGLNSCVLLQVNSNIFPLKMPVQPFLYMDLLKKYFTAYISRVIYL